MSDGFLFSFVKILDPRKSLLLAITSLAIIHILDRNTPSYITLNSLYTIPVMIAAWGSGRSAAFGIALLATASWAYASYLVTGPFSNATSFISNSLCLFAGFITPGIVVYILKEKINSEQELRLSYKKSEEKLRESNTLLSLFIHHSPIYTYIKEVTPTESRVLEASENFEQMAGIKGSNIVGKTMAEVFPADLAANILADDLAVVSGKKTLEVQEEFAGRTYTSIKFPIVRSGRSLLAGFTIDITERKEAEETNRLLALEKSHTQKMDSLGSLAGGVAHDFNNMLSGVMGYADLLLSGEEDPKRQKYLRSIMAAASRSADLTQKLLAFGRRGKNLVEPLLLKPLVEDCISMLHPSMNPDLQVVLAMEDCPSIDADPSQIHQVVLNLCLNAIEAMPERGTLRIATRSLMIEDANGPGTGLTNGCYVELRVTDTGVGMIEEVRQRVFEPFFTTKIPSGASGTGLGLSTAFGIVQAHHGAITVESSIGKGTAFRVLLPKGVLAPMNSQTRPVMGMATGAVLLVEDEPILRDLGTSVLETLGFEVIAAEDGLAGVAAFQEHHKRLCAVLLDLKMPKMGGREAFQQFQNLDRSVPVIVCTGYGENEEVQDLLTQGAAGVVAKPYQIATMAAALKQVTSGG